MVHAKKSGLLSHFTRIFQADFYRKNPDEPIFTRKMGTIRSVLTYVA